MNNPTETLSHEKPGTAFNGCLMLLINLAILFTAAFLIGRTIYLATANAEVRLWILFGSIC